MPSPLTLYVESEQRAAKFRVAAAFAGQGVKLLVKVVDPTSEEGKTIRDKTPFGRIPVLETTSGYIARTNAIFRYIAGLREDVGLYEGGVSASSPYVEACIDQLLEWSYTSLEPLLLLASGAAIPGYGEQAIAAARQAAMSKLPPVLAYLDTFLTTRTYLTSERISLADINIATALSTAWDVLSTTLTPSFVHLNRWYATCRGQPEFVSVLGVPGAAPPAANSGKQGGGKKNAAASASGGGGAVGAGAGAVPTTTTTTTTTSSSSSAPFIAPPGNAENGWSAVVGTGIETQIEERFRRHRQRIAELFKTGEAGIGSEVTVCGWVRTTREAGGGSICFVALHDGSCFDTIQAVLEKDKTEGFADVLVRASTGASLKIVGTIVKSLGKVQSIEIAATKVTILGEVLSADRATYPLAKGKHSLETLREYQHLRPRTNTFGAVTRVRNACAFATHKFFNDRGFLYIHTPIITTADCEGAGEMFQVTTLVPSDVKGNLPRTKDGSIDYKKDFFGKPAMMTVSGQLQVEAFACSMTDVYTFGPTFRAENSHTSRHLAEFWMIEPEIAFATLQEDMALAEDYLKFCTQWVLDHCDDDLKFFEAQFEKGLKARLQNVVREPFQKLTYTDAIELLLSPEHAAAGNFLEKPYWGFDLGSEHERYITEKVFKKPVILINYPKDIKAFYMKLNPDGKTVAAMDVLVPKIGEIIGGSQREDDFEKLRKRMQEMNVVEDPLKWYMELRKYGTVPHAGFGLGFERLVMYVTGIENIRDAIPFPRWPGNAAL